MVENETLRSRKDRFERFRTEQMRILETNRAAYNGLSPELLDTHRGVYVGIVDGRIVGFHEDEKVLEISITERFGDDVNVYLRMIGDSHDRPPLVIRSPRIYRRLERFFAEQIWGFERDMAAYEAMNPELGKAHYGEYVGIVDGKIVSFDKDLDSLETSIEERFGSVEMYLRMVGRE